MVLLFSGTNRKRTEGAVTLYQKGIVTRRIDLSDRVGKRIFTLDTAELGATKTLLAKAMNISRQTLHNYQQTKDRMGVEGLIHSYSTKSGTTRTEQRKINQNKLPRGNKSEQLAALRAGENRQIEGAQNSLNFSLGQQAAAEIPAEEAPFSETHEWEASRYAGIFIY